MNERCFETELGTIVYWVNDLLLEKASAKGFAAKDQTPTHRKNLPNPLIFLPGLTADHRLFDKQIDYFNTRAPLLVWDAPGHGKSRPFALEFSLDDKARWLKAILDAETLEKPVLVGQSMGGYVAQAFMQLYPGAAAGFASIDSAPLQRSYYSSWELWLLERMEPVYRRYPHGLLVSQGSKGCSETAYGRALMRDMISAWRHEEYAVVAGHGFRILAQAVRKDLPYEIDCPCVLICGEKDKAGSAKRYNRRWTKQTGLPLHWISDAGHNANTDKPEAINAILNRFLSQ